MDRPIKILFIIDKLAPGIGGTATHLTEVLRMLDRRLYSPFVCALGGEKEGVHVDRIKALGVDIVFFGIDKIYGCKAILSFLKVVNFIKRHEFDLVCTYLFSSNIYGVFAAKFAQTKIIISNRREIVSWKRCHHKLVSRISNQFCSKIIVNSQASKIAVLMAEKAPSDKVMVIHNGINIDKFNPSAGADVDLRAKLGIKKTDYVIGMISNFIPVKDHETLLVAFAEACKKYSNIVLLLLGGGPLESRIRRTACELGVSDKVIFSGRQSDVRPYLGIMDIYVSSSLFEGFSNAIIEAMAMAKPVIVSKTGGNIDAVIDGYNGLLFIPGDRLSLVSKLLVILKDGELRQRMGAAGRKRVEENFTSEKMVENTEKLYLSLLENI